MTIVGSAPTRPFDPAIRDATVADREEFVRLATRALTHLDDQRGGEVFRHAEARSDVGQTIDADLSDMSAGSAHVVLGCLGPVPVGYAVSRRRSSGDGVTAVVTDLYVEPEARCVGVGRGLMVALVERALADGCTGIEAAVLPGDRATKNFFEAFGLVARKITVHKSLVDGST